MERGGEDELEGGGEEIGMFDRRATSRSAGTDSAEQPCTWNRLIGSGLVHVGTDTAEAGSDTRSSRLFPTVSASAALLTASQANCH